MIPICQESERGTLSTGQLKQFAEGVSCTFAQTYDGEGYVVWTASFSHPQAPEEGFGIRKSSRGLNHPAGSAHEIDTQITCRRNLQWDQWRR